MKRKLSESNFKKSKKVKDSEYEIVENEEVGSEDGDEEVVENNIGEEEEEEEEEEEVEKKKEEESLETETCLMCNRGNTDEKTLSGWGKNIKNKVKTYLEQTGGKSNQWKLGFAGAHTETTYVNLHETTKYVPEMRWCRILSTCARGYLLTQFPAVEEVQCAYDPVKGRFLLSTNSNRQTEALANNTDPTWFDWATGNNAFKPKSTKSKKARTSKKPIKVSNADLRFRARLERHRNVLRGGDTLASDFESSEKEGFKFLDEVTDRKPILKCNKIVSKTVPTVFSEKELNLETNSKLESTVTKFEDFLFEKEDKDEFGVEKIDKKLQGAEKKSALPKNWWRNLEYVKGQGKGDMHTETKIVYYLLEELGGGKKQEKTEEKEQDEEAEEKKEEAPKHEYSGKSIWIAGVMRPCLCCFIRLQRLKKELFAQCGVVLEHKPRPGLFWPSRAALNGMTEEDLNTLDEFLKNLRRPETEGEEMQKVLFVEGDFGEETERLEETSLNVTGDEGIKGQFLYQIDSESETDSQDEKVVEDKIELEN